MQTYSHSGDCGDLIATLPTVKALGGGRLVLFPADCTGRRMTPEMAESLRPLLEAQEYLHAVEWRDGPEGINLDDWRNHYKHHLNLSDMVADRFGVPHWPRERPWLTVPSARRVARVVMHRSSRWLNWGFINAWKRLWEQFRLDAVFVGHPEEHAEFCLGVGPVAYYHTKHFLELAEVIAGCDLYVGNQSSPWWVAEGLKVPSVLEVCLSTQNCHFGRWGLIYGANEHVRLPLPAELEERWACNMTKRAGERTVITEDRLTMIARSVREVERLPGDMAELGVYRGGSAAVISSVAPQKPLHLFDTFEGLPADEYVGHGHRRGEFAAGVDEVRGFLAGHNVKIHHGVFPETARTLLENRFSFVHLDADLYDSTLAGIDFFWPRLVRGGVIVFDDVDWSGCPGVNKALEDRHLLDLVERTAPQQGRIRKE